MMSNCQKTHFFFLGTQHGSTIFNWALNNWVMPSDLEQCRWARHAELWDAEAAAAASDQAMFAMSMSTNSGLKKRIPTLRTVHKDLSDPGTHQSYTNNSHQPPLPFLWGNHSFFMPASQTSKLTCFAQAMLGHKISGPSSSQHLPRTNPQGCKCPCNLQVTKKHCRMTLSILLRSHWSQSRRKLDFIHVLSGFQDACVGQLLWIEYGCCSDLTGKKTSPTRFFQRNTKHMGFLNTKSWIFLELQANWGLRPSTRSLWNANLHVKNCEATMRRTKNLRANIGTSWQVPAESEYDCTLSI